MNENVQISMKISLNFVPKGPINNIPSLVQIMDWHRSGVKPLSEPMMVRLLMHKCAIWPQRQLLNELRQILTLTRLWGTCNVGWSLKCLYIVIKISGPHAMQIKQNKKQLFMGGKPPETEYPVNIKTFLLNIYSTCCSKVISMSDNEVVCYRQTSNMSRN